jgi:heptosyltransferase-1
MPRTLVIQLGRLGDVIQATPLLVELAAAGDQVDVLVLSSTHTAVLGLSGVANIITIPEALKPLDDAIACEFPRGNIPVEAHELLADLELPLYDRVINASHAPLGCWLAATIPCANPGDRYGGVILDRECLYFGPASAYRVASVQFREQNLFNLVDLIRAIPGPATPSAHRRLYVNQAAALPFALPAGRRVALNPGASEPARCWPAENFARLAEALSTAGFAALLVGAPSDRELCEKIGAAAGVPIPNFAGRTTIPEMAALLARCELLVSADTGAAHVAAAAGTTVLGLYGASAWFAETAPYGNNHLILQTPLNAPMSAISVDSAIAAALNRLHRLSDTDLGVALQHQNQSAWETSVDSPSPTDPLGGLTYRPLHREALAADELFARSLRQSFATEFLQRGSTLETRQVDKLTQTSSVPDSLAEILDRMRTVATSCANSARTELVVDEVHSAGKELIVTVDRLRALISDPAWKPLGPILHNLDWQLRMLPQQPMDATFRAHANAYAFASRVLRNANSRRRNDADQENLTKRENCGLEGCTAKEGKEGGQVPSSVRIQAPARQRGSVSP